VKGSGKRCGFYRCRRALQNLQSAIEMCQGDCEILGAQRSITRLPLASQLLLLWCGLRVERRCHRTKQHPNRAENGSKTRRAARKTREMQHDSGNFNRRGTPAASIW